MKFVKLFAVTVAMLSLVAVGSEAKAANAHETLPGIEVSDAQYELREAITASTAKLVVLKDQAVDLAARIAGSKVYGPKAARLHKQLAAANAAMIVERETLAKLFYQLRNSQPVESLPTLPLAPELAPA